MGATAAQREWMNLHGHQLAEGQKPPPREFFTRQRQKFKTHGSVENRVFIFVNYFKFIYSEKATKFCKILTLLLTCTT